MSARVQEWHPWVGWERKCLSAPCTCREAGVGKGNSGLMNEFSKWTLRRARPGELLRPSAPGRPGSRARRLWVWLRGLRRSAWGDWR